MTESQPSSTQATAAKPGRTILVVDDEPSILNAVRRELHSTLFRGEHLEVETCTNPLEALERAKHQAFDLVISDYRMPEMDGLAFLKAFALIQPDCLRLVLSGQTDFDALIRMINETHIYRFIPKPWTEYFLKSSITQALRLRDTSLENRRLAKIMFDHGLAMPGQVLTDSTELILIVDDEPNVLNALARDLSHHSNLDDMFSALRSETSHHTPAKLEQTKLSIQICTSPLHALKMAESVNFSCIIADYHMPEMDGVTLLQHYEEKQPDCARILISGVASTENLVIALDLAHIFSYIGKPWVDFELKSSVAQALQHRRMTIENRVLAEMLRAKDIDLVQ